MTYRVKQSEPSWRPRNVDIAIVTAMDDERMPVMEVSTDDWYEFTIDKFPHYHTNLRICSTSLSVVTCSLWKYGQTPTASAISRLRDLRPKLIVMTGICAGWEEKDIQLGDIIVATRAYNPDEGKLTNDGLLPDTDTFHPDPWMIKQLQSFEHNSSWTQDVKTPRPLSLRYQAELLLCAMNENQVPFYDKSISETAKEKNIDILTVRDWLAGKNYIIKKTGKLTKTARERLIEIGLNNPGDWKPATDRLSPKVHLGTFASGQFVVAADGKFFEYGKHVRSIRAIEMEVAALYQSVSEMDGVLMFAVKGVSDYGTPDKDDSFRRYAAEVSTRWAISFINSKWRAITETRQNQDSKLLITIRELSEWKTIHNDTQSLITSLESSFSLLKICRSEKSNTLLEKAGFKWQAFVSQLEPVLRRWHQQSAHTPEFDELQVQMSKFSNTTKILMGAEINQDSELRIVESRLGNLEDILWRLLTIADHKIQGLIERLKTCVD